jgi:acyl carrier protein
MPRENEIKEQVFRFLRDRLDRLSIREHELGEDFDLVRSGLLNSVEFVDMTVAIENLNSIEIDYEMALDAGDFTTLGGLVRAITRKL